MGAAPREERSFTALALARPRSLSVAINVMDGAASGRAVSPKAVLARAGFVSWFKAGARCAQPGETGAWPPGDF